MGELKSDIVQRCVTIFTRLGWEVNVGESVKILPRKSIKPTFVLRHNGEIYGFVEVTTSTNVKNLGELIDTVIINVKPPIFVLTNGYAFEIFHLGESYGTLTVPPTPDDVNTLLDM